MHNVVTWCYNFLYIECVILTMGLTFDIDITKENAIGLRRNLGVDKKDRVSVHFRIEREYVEYVRAKYNDNLSDAANVAFNLLFCSRGWENDPEFLDLLSSKRPSLTEKPFPYRSPGGGVEGRPVRDLPG